MMRAFDPATKLDELHDAGERISANLVDLEIDSGRQLLDAGTLEGRSAARWGEATTALTELWREHGLLQELLRVADELRGARHADDLAELLSGPSIGLAIADVPIAERQLLGSSQVEERCTPDQLLVRMSAAFDQVRATIAEIGGAWDLLMPKLEVARRAAAEAGRQADELDESDRADLGGAVRTLDELTATVTADPLSASAAEIEQLSTSLREIVSELEGALELKRGFERRLLEAREQLNSLETAIGECASAREELARKISNVTAAPDPGPCAQLGPELDAIGASAGRREWREAARALDAWTAQVDSLMAQATRAREVNRSPIEARNQFRALLDAYRVKAARLGRVEDPQLAAIFEQAQGVLYTAPADLAQAAQLVRDYQRALGAPAVAADEAKVKR
jgi:DNA repair exonuclease SbcCD ATPase subunit